MTNRELVLKALEDWGRNKAKEIQEKSDEMTSDELYDNKDYIPLFIDAVIVENMKYRETGFKVVAPSGIIMSLIKPYDSDIYPEYPEALPSEWRYFWARRPEDALPFRVIATSPYAVGDYCIFNDKIYRCKMNNISHSPVDFPQAWEEVEE